MLYKINKIKNTLFYNLSIVNRVTLFYTLFLTILMGVVFSSIYIVTNHYVISEQETSLRYIVNDVIEDYEEGEPFSDIEDGVHLSLYNREGILLKGTVPFIIENNTFENNTIREIKTETGTYLYIDFYSSLQKEWIRGSISVTAGISYVKTLLQVMLIILPFILILILIIGYFIIKSAFTPMRKLTDTIKEIQNSNDLSKRVNLNGGKDEIYQLTDMFNSMLDSVELSYNQKRKFTSDVSHELRTPISVILTSSQLGKIENDKESIYHLFDTIERQSKQMKYLVEDLLEIERLSQLKNLEKKENNFSKIVMQKIEDFTLLSKVKNIKIESNIQEDIAFYFNDVLINRLLDNLLSNAMKFTKNKIIVNVLKTQHHIILSIEDDGIGIESEHLIKIFDRFYQIDYARHKQSFKSYGLGLSFVKKIVDLHGGQIEIDSKKNQYTKFKILFHQ